MATPPDDTGPVDAANGPNGNGRNADDPTELLPLHADAESTAAEAVPVSRSSTSTPIVLAILAVAAAIGLIAGAVWGLSGRSSNSAAPTPPVTVVTPTPTLSSASPTPTPTPTRTPSPTSTPTKTPTPTKTSTTTATATSTPTPTPTVTGNFPPAPPANQLTSNGWKVANYFIHSKGGQIEIDATVTNSATIARSATLTLYAYINGTPLATLKASVIQLGANASQPTVFTSTDKWRAGPKVLLLTVGD